MRCHAAGVVEPGRRKGSCRWVRSAGRIGFRQTDPCRGSRSHARWATGRLELLLVVDLGALEAPREVDVDRLPLGKRVERGVARLAVAVAGLLPAAEREVRLGARRAGVDVADAGLEGAHRPE